MLIMAYFRYLWVLFTISAILHSSRVSFIFFSISSSLFAHFLHFHFFHFRYSYIYLENIFYTFSLFSPFYSLRILFMGDIFVFTVILHLSRKHHICFSSISSFTLFEFVFLFRIFSFSVILHLTGEHLLYFFSIFSFWHWNKFSISDFFFLFLVILHLSQEQHLCLFSIRSLWQIILISDFLVHIGLFACISSR